MRPCYAAGLNNRVFGLNAMEKTPDDHWTIPYAKWRSLAQDNHILLDTWDIRPVEEADMVIVQDLPLVRQELATAKARAKPGTPFILLLYESPVSRCHYHDPKNHDLFDAVVTYNGRICDENRYFRYWLPTSHPQTPPAFIPFDDRKPIAMINENRFSGLLAPRKQGMAGLPVIGPIFGGWHVDWRMKWRIHRGALYQVRRTYARIAGERFPGLFDVYGAGWKGERGTSLRRFFANTPYPNAKGRLNSPKLDCLAAYRFTLAFENCTNDIGYISEKIFDAYFSGSVPVYLGEQSIHDQIPSDSYIDARQFQTPKDLFEFIESCPRQTWERYFEAGRKYIQSDAIERFLSNHFAGRMLHVMQLVAASSTSGPRQSAASVAR